MRAIKLCLIILIGAVVIDFIRSDRAFHIAKSLPFSNSPEKVDMYDFAGVAALGVVAWGIYRLNRKNEDG